MEYNFGTSYAVCRRAIRPQTHNFPEGVNLQNRTGENQRPGLIYRFRGGRAQGGSRKLPVKAYYSSRLYGHKANRKWPLI